MVCLFYIRYEYDYSDRKELRSTRKKDSMCDISWLPPLAEDVRTKGMLVDMVHNLLPVSKNCAQKLAPRDLRLLLGREALDWRRTCNVVECSHPPCATGRCTYHTLRGVDVPATLLRDIPQTCCIVSGCAYPAYRRSLCLEHLSQHYHNYYRRSVHVYVFVRGVDGTPRLVVGRTPSDLYTVFGGFCEHCDTGPVDTGLREFMEETRGRLLTRERLATALRDSGTMYTGRTATHLFVEVDSLRLDQGVVDDPEVVSLDLLSLPELAQRSLRTGLLDHLWLVRLHLGDDRIPRGTQVLPAPPLDPGCRKNFFLRDTVSLVPYQAQVLADPYPFQRSFQQACSWIRQHFKIHTLARGTVLYHATSRDFAEFGAETFFSQHPELSTSMFRQGEGLHVAILVEDVQFLDFACDDDSTSLFGKELVRLVLGRFFFARESRAQETDGADVTQSRGMFDRLHPTLYDGAYQRYLRQRHENRSLSSVVHQLNKGGATLGGWCAVDRLDAFVPIPVPGAVEIPHCLKNRRPGYDVGGAVWDHYGLSNHAGRHRTWSREFVIMNPNVVRHVPFSLAGMDAMCEIHAHVLSEMRAEHARALESTGWSTGLADRVRAGWQASDALYHTPEWEVGRQQAALRDALVGLPLDMEPVRKRLYAMEQEQRDAEAASHLFAGMQWAPAVAALQPALLSDYQAAKEAAATTHGTGALQQFLQTRREREFPHDTVDPGT